MFVFMFAYVEYWAVLSKIVFEIFIYFHDIKRFFEKIKKEIYIKK